MEFLELTQEEYSAFQKKSPFHNFTNSLMNMRLYELRGIHVKYCGVKKDGVLVLSCAMVEKIILRKFKYLYVVRGPLCDFRDVELLGFYIKNLKAYAKKKHYVKVVFDPYVLYKERDRDGAYVEGGFDNSYVIENLKKCGLMHEGFTIGYNKNEQFIRFMYSTYLNNETEDSIFKKLERGTRNNINKMKRYAIKVVELKENELERFYKISQSTADRRHFLNHGETYFKLLKKAYGDQARFMLAYLDLEMMIEKDKKEISELEEKIMDLKTNHIQSSRIERNIKEQERLLMDVKKRLAKSVELKEKHGDKIDLASSIFLFEGDEITYFVSGSYEEFMMYRGQYALQWWAITYGLKNGYKRYNFYGINGIFDKNDAEYGVYEFKRGFPGKAEELVGDFKLVLRPLIDKVYEMRNGR